MEILCGRTAKNVETLLMFKNVHKKTIFADERISTKMAEKLNFYKR